ncbi:MAG TPA: cyclic nucleotide-binding domain-containing protein, partial [Acidimicrobiia bacterium]
VATLLGSIAASALADNVGLRFALVVGGAIPIVVLVFVMPRLARLDRSSGARVRELQPRIDVIGRLGIFDGASVPAIEQLAAAVTEQSVGAGTVVIREGDVADAFYVVHSGTLTVTVERGTDTAFIDELGPESYFGEIGLVERAPRNATVTTTADGVLWRIDGVDFLAALEHAPRLDSFTNLMVARSARAVAPPPVA